MKKTVLLLLLVLTLSCSKDDSNDAKAKDQGCYMKVLSMHTQYSGDIPIYHLQYGTSDEDSVDIVINEKIKQFYTTRFDKGNDHWIGEVDHE